MHLSLLILALITTAVTADNGYEFMDLDLFVNNKGASGPGSDFDGAGTFFNCPALSHSQQSNNTALFGSLPFKHTFDTHGNDNIMSHGQIIPLPNKPYGAMYLLASVNHGPVTTDLTLIYQDGSQATTTLNLPDWQDGYAEQIHRIDLSYCKLSNNANGLLFVVPILTDPTKNASHLQLPHHDSLGSFTPAMHIFAITALQADTAPVQVVSVKGTRRWWEERRAAAQREYPIVTVRVHNTGSTWIHDASVVLKGPLFKTQYHGNIKRLAPGHAMNVDVGIYTVRKGRAATTVIVDVFDALRRPMMNTSVVLENVEVGIEDYEQDERSLRSHSVPAWYQSAKFGIFIHWGVYAVPSWAPVGGEYAEWYWWNYNQKHSATYKYHRSFYGPDIEYDDFIGAWDPHSFDAETWMDVIDSSRAKYFVFTTKHHDGIALFDTKVTDRSSVKMNPHRDFVRELLTVAKNQYPDLKRGVYFSLPEWYHPSYHDSGLNWNGPPKNPYTGKRVKYTGASKVDDFVNEIQVPQVLELIDTFEPDIMWCDIGGINNSTAWQAYFINKAREQGRQVTINDRCGNSASDFATIEYNRGQAPSRFWESTRGIDPLSFGFNHQTKPEQYASTRSLLQEFVSVIANGGNFLLNIGPEASGHIPHIMKKTLKEMGQWIDRVEESVFDSVPYWLASHDMNEPGQPLYFTQAKDGKAIYVFSLEPLLDRKLVVKTKVPIHQDSKISLLSSPEKEPLRWRLTSSDKLLVHVPDHITDQENLVWVFKIEAP